MSDESNLAFTYLRIQINQNGDEIKISQIE